MRDLTYVVLTNWDVIFAIILGLIAVISVILGIKEFIKYCVLYNEVKECEEFKNTYFVQTDLKRD